MAADTTEETTEDEATEETEGSAEGTTTEEAQSEEEAGKVKSDDPWKLKSRKNEEKAKAALKRAEAAEAKVKQFEDANKSESEKLTEKASTAEQEATSAKSDAARLRVALKKGLTEVQAKRLVGETEEELEADADELLDSFREGDDEDGKESEKDEQPVRRRPKERTKTGATGATEPEESDPAKLAARVSRDY